MQKEIFGSWSLDGCGCSSSGFGGGAACPPAIFVSLLLYFLSFPSKDINPITKLVLFITYTLQNPNLQIKNQTSKNSPTSKWR